jgi:ATP-dependent metalloprotease FtsH
VNLFPVVVLAGLLYFVIRSTGAGRALGRRFVLQISGGVCPRVTFDDVGGQASAKKELLEALELVNRPERARRLGIRPIKGILLAGPPGTGKTLLAKAAANFTDSVFLATSGSEFIEVYAGVGAQRVRELFRRAREQARHAGKKSAVVFIDELEVLGGKRGRYSAHLEYDQTLNQLLVEMDGLSIEDDVRILLIGATNRPDLLDPALLRPGRFDRVVRVDLPDREGRLQILKVHTRGKPLAPDVNLEAIARETMGFSGAHLESLANEAAILAMREGLTQVAQRHLEEAIDKVMMGEKLDRKPRGQELFRVAVHEAGHALVSELINPGSISCLTISPRGSALGYVRQAPHDDLYLYARSELEDQICVLLAGAVAEELVLGEPSTGAANDYDAACQAARRMVYTGLSVLGAVDPELVSGDAVQRAMSDIMTRQRQRALDLLGPRVEAVRRLAERVLECETLSGEEIRSVLAPKVQGRDAPTGWRVRLVRPTSPSVPGTPSGGPGGEAPGGSRGRRNRAGRTEFSRQGEEPA